MKNDGGGAARVVTALSEHGFPAALDPARTNLLVGQSSDINTACPEYKVIAVSVRPLDTVEATPLADAQRLATRAR